MIIVDKPLAGGAGRVHTSGFSAVLTRVNVLLLALFSATSLQATYYFNGPSVGNSASQSALGVSASMSVEWNGVSSTATWRHTQSGSGGGAWITNSLGNVYHSETNYSAGYGTVIHDHSPGSAIDHTGTFSVTAGNWYQLAARVSIGGDTYDTIVYWQAGDTTPYYADFAVPGNLGGEAVTVTVWQNGAVITSTTVSPGAGASTLHVTGLEATGRVTVVYGYGVYETLPGGSIVFTANKDFETAGGTDPTAASEPPEPTQLLPMRLTPQTRKQPEAVVPTTLPTQQTTPTATPAASAATTIVRHVRVGTGIPFGTPSGTGAVTKQDSEVVANAVVAAIDATDTNRDNSDAKTLDAVNQVAAVIGTTAGAGLTALNALRTETVVGRNKQLDVSGQSQRTLEAILVEERKSNSYLDSAVISLGELEMGFKAPVQADSNTAMTAHIDLGSDLMASVAEATELQPNKGSVATDDGDAGSNIPTVAIPGGTATPHTISLNPLNHPKIQQLATLFRALVGWIVLFSLIAWTYIQIPIWMTDALKGGSGFTAWRAATGALPLIGIAVATFLIVGAGAVILTAPTIMWAYADPLMMGSAGTALIDVRTIITNFGGTGAGEMISLLDAVCPTGLFMTAVFNYITLRIGGQSICAGLIAFSKVLAS